MNVASTGGPAAKAAETARTTENLVPVRRQARHGHGPEADRVQISERSREMARLEARSAATTAPHTERIERLREMVRSGAYTPDPDRIARRMLDEVW